MRHNKHSHQLGVTKEHRAAIMASLSAALFRHDRIETTLGHAKALRPFAEKIITLAKKAAATEDKIQKLHFFRLALAQVRDDSALHFLFTEKVKKFVDRKGGYTRIYKLVPRAGDAADMAIIELIEADDKGYAKKGKETKKGVKKPAKKAAKKADEAVAEEAPAEVVEVAGDAEAPAKKTPAKKAAAKKAPAKKVADDSKADDK